MGDVIGIMLGAPEPTGVLLYDETSKGKRVSGLLDSWKRHVQPQIEALAASFEERSLYIAWEEEVAEARYVPARTHPTGPRVIGFWVITNGGYEMGVPDLRDGPRSLYSLRKLKSYKRAMRAWKRFARWASTQGVEVGEPRLVLAMRSPS